MAKRSEWNSSFWKTLDKLGKIDERQIINIIQEELNKVDTIMIDKTPKKYGGLLASHYAVLVPTEHGYSGRVGYTNRQHINLNPSSPGYDKFTNTQLMDILLNAKKVSENVFDISYAIGDFRENCRNRVMEYLSSGGR